MLFRSSSYPYDKRRSASSMMRWVTLSKGKAELSILCHAVAGVQTTMSGESDKKVRWRGSDTWPVSLAILISRVQNAENCSITLKTWSASSRVGTRIRPEIAAVESVYKFLSVYRYRHGSTAGRRESKAHTLFRFKTAESSGRA